MGRRIIGGVIPVALLSIFYFMIHWYVRSMVYPAPSISVPSEPPTPLEDVKFNLQSGARIVGWHFKSSRETAPALIYFHGNGENLETLRLSGFLDILISKEVSFLAIDYPGYGRSSGPPSESSIHESASRSILWMREKYQNRNLIVCGWSLGAAVAVRAAADHQKEVDGLIAMSAWTSLQEAAVNHFPKWMVHLLLRESFDSASAAPKVQCPTLIIHGSEDTLIPVGHGEKVASKLGGKSRWILVSAGHNDLLNHPQVWNEIDEFLKLFDGERYSKKSQKASPH